MTKEIGSAERLARLRLARTRGIGSLTYGQLMAKTGSGIEAVAQVPDLADRAKRRLSLATEEAAEEELRTGEAAGYTLITLGEKTYPSSLAAIPDPPPTLWLAGRHQLLERDGVAIVGARNASAAGRQLTAQIAEALGREGFVVTSGMARGIDGAAHTASLETGTIAVLAGGVDNIYPPEHAGLHRDIVRLGLVVSEQPLGMTARAQDFPKRNRIVSGLSRGVVVVEAAERSGTLITARLAAEQGREVFAVPGSPLDPRAKGTNGLLRKGATLIESADDVIAELQTAISNRTLFDINGFAEEFCETDLRGARDRLLSLLSFTPIHRDTLIAESGLGAAEVAACLLELVLDGEALEETGGLYVRSAS